MKVLEVLPVKFYEFHCKPKLLKNALKEVKKLPWMGNETNWISACSLNYRKEFKELHEWFQECLDKVVKNVGYAFPFQSKITQSWANKAIGNQWHKGHMHPGSFISGSFYLTTGEGETWFSIHDLWKPEYLHSADDRGTYYKSPSEAGKLIIFPGDIYHSVSGANTTEDNPRYTIAFNSFPHGPVGRFTTHVDITVNPVTQETDEKYFGERFKAGKAY